MSEAPDERTTSAAAQGERSTVGEMLRTAREARGESVGDVAGTLKLTSRQVEAMEVGRFELLPGPAFVRGFVRNYGRHLGLDQAALSAALEREIAAPSVELAPVSNAAGVMPSGVSARPTHRPLAAVVVLLVLAIVAGWYFDWFQAPEREAGAGDEASVAEPPGTVLGPAPTIIDDGEAPTAAPLAPPAVQAPGEAAPGAAVPTPAPPSTPPSTPEPAAPAQAEQVAPPAPQAASMPAAGAPDQLMFRLRGESWIEVRDASGTILFSGVAPAGSTRAVQGKPPFAVVIGNAPQVSVEYRGQPVDLGLHTRVGVARLTVQ